MKINEMVLVTENRKGTETNFLMSFSDFLTTIVDNCISSKRDRAFTLEELFETKDNKKWCDIYLTSNYSFQARFCGGESELRGFLFGNFNEKENGTKEFTFDTERCTKECFEVLAAYDMKTDGHTAFGSFHYEDQHRNFSRGEVLQNFNGSSYKILSVLGEKNLLLMALSDGQILVGKGTKYYKRYPKEEYRSSDSIREGVEWDHGVYLGYDVTGIDYVQLKAQYGKSESKLTLAEYRTTVAETFQRYMSIFNDERMSDVLKMAAVDDMVHKYGTYVQKDFEEALGQGFYDGHYHGIETDKMVQRRSQYTEAGKIQTGKAR